MRKILVTGGAGFIGSNYVRWAVKRHPDWQITVIDSLTYAGKLENLEGLREKVTFFPGNIAEPTDVREAMQGCDTVVNFAAESHVDRALGNCKPFIRSNIEGVVTLLDEAKRIGVKRFLQVSTDEVYSELLDSTYHSIETSNYGPRNPYSASKAAAEHFVMSYHNSYGMDTVITRGSNTYGPYQYPEKAIPVFTIKALRDEPIPLYGNGKAVRDYMHVEDHVSGIDLVLEKGTPGGIYNLGAREQITGIDLVRNILRILRKPELLISYVTDRPGHDYRYSMDPSKTEKLGWTRKWNFQDGLIETVNWYRDHRERWIYLN